MTRLANMHEHARVLLNLLPYISSGLIFQNHQSLIILQSRRIKQMIHPDDNQAVSKPIESHMATYDHVHMPKRLRKQFDPMHARIHIPRL